MNPSDYAGIAGLPLVVAIVEMAKKMFPDLPARFLPAVSVAVGVLLYIGIAWLLKGDVRVASFIGVVTGMAASGLYAYGADREKIGG